MTFVKTVCIDEKTWDGEDYDYDDITCGDYIVFALWDITDENHPKMIMCDDNIHTPIESDIESFIEGVKYAIDINYSDRNILLCENEYQPKFNLDKLIRCVD